MEGKTRIWLAMALLFVSGVAVGFFGSGLLLRHRINEFVGRGPSAMHSRLVHRALHGLDLTAEQRAEIDRILGESEPMLRDHAEQFRSTMDDALVEQHDRIKAVLTDEQRIEFERRLEEARRRFEDMRDRRRPHREDRREGSRPPGDGF